MRSCVLYGNDYLVWCYTFTVVDASIKVLYSLIALLELLQLNQLF